MVLILIGDKARVEVSHLVCGFRMELDGWANYDSWDLVRVFCAPWRGLNLVFDDADVG
jgi:hypothetical protein